MKTRITSKGRTNQLGRKTVITTIIVLVFQNLLFATPQARDVLFWNNNKYYVFPFIDIESILNGNELEELNALKTSDPPTSNYRGYSCEFEIANDSLFLVSVKDANKNDLTESIFGCQIRRHADFFSDTLYLGYGQSFYDEIFWTPIYESEMTVVLENGVVRWFKDNPNKTKHSPYTYNPQLFFGFVYSQIHWAELDEQILKTKPNVVVGFEMDSVEKINEVNILKSSGYAEFDNEAVRVIKAIPSFSISFVKGRYIRHPYTFRILFDVQKAHEYGVDIDASLLENSQTNNIYEPENHLNKILEECIIKSKNKYENFSNLTNINRMFLLCCDGLPDMFLEQNKSFYENIGLETMSWHNTNKYQEELTQGMDVMEVLYYLRENAIVVYVHVWTATKENGELFLASWFEDIDKYIYEYSCETNEWRLKED